MLAVLSIVLMSSQFTANGPIPAAHTCPRPRGWTCAGGWSSSRNLSVR